MRLVVDEGSASRLVVIMIEGPEEPSTRGHRAS
jgi:hypothetical protein